jgi:hypothetical protein
MLKGLALAGVFAATLGEAAAAQGLIEDDSAVGYPSVAAAFEAVKAEPNVHISAENNCTVIFSA